MDMDDLSPEEAHPWLDEPDDLTNYATLPHNAVTMPYHDPGGQTVPAFTHDSGTLVLPDDTADNTGWALALYAVFVLVCLTGLFAMFFVLGGRFVHFTHPAAIVYAHAVVGGQTGGLPTPTPGVTPHPASQQTPAAPQPQTVPVVGIKPIHPIPLQPQPPVVHHPTPKPPSPPATPIPSPTAPPVSSQPTPTAPPQPPATAPALTIAPAAIRLACHPESPQTVPGAVAFTLHNTSDQPLGWNVTITSGSFDITPISGIIAPGASARVILADLATSGSLLVSSTQGDFPITVNVC